MRCVIGDLSTLSAARGELSETGMILVEGIALAQGAAVRPARGQPRCSSV